MSWKFGSNEMQLLLVFMMTFTSSFSVPVDVCSIISNPDCSCSHSSSSSASSGPPDITCAFVSMPPSPFFASRSSVGAVGTLDLSGNQLEDLPDDFFHENLTVDRLVLSRNNLTQIPSAVWRLAAVTTLDLSENNLSSLFPNEEKNGAKLPGLKKLNLSRNLISSIDSQVFAAMRHLSSLDMSRNRLPEVTDIMFSQLELSLVSLDISHNAVSTIPGLALQHLQHLRSLSLAHNPLTDVNDVKFPQHLRSLDLSHCALTIIDHCQLSSLADLSFIGLAGNDLQCTCQLYLLLQWYKNQHHEAGIVDANNMGSNWTCNTAPTSIPTAPPTGHDVTTDAPASGEKKVAELTYCMDTESHCQTLEHSDHHLKGSSQMVVSLDVASSDDTIMASWTFEENGEVMVDGFRLRYIPEDAELLTSPIIPADQRAYVLHHSGLEEHFRVCLDVLAFETAVVHMECRSFKDESGSIVVGILAGVIFIVPCIVAMVYVLIKDRKLSKEAEEEYEPLKGAEKDAEKQEDTENDQCVFKAAGASRLLTSASSVQDETAQFNTEASNKTTAPIKSTGSSEKAAPAEQASRVAEDAAESVETSPPSDQPKLRREHEGPTDPPQARGVSNLGFVACDGGDCRTPHHESTYL